MSNFPNQLRNGFDHKTLPYPLSIFYHEIADHIENLERKLATLDITPELSLYELP